MSVEYLARIEPGRDRNPSPAVVNALADALCLNPSERNHLRCPATITGDACPTGFRVPARALPDGPAPLGFLTPAFTGRSGR